MTQLPGDIRSIVEAYTRIVAAYFHDHAAWPAVARVSRRLGRELGRDTDVRAAIRRVPNDYGHSGYGSEDLAVAKVKALATFARDLVGDDLRLFVSAVNRLVEIDDNAPDEAETQVTNVDLEGLTTHPEEIAKLKLLLQLEGLLAGGGSGADFWSYGIANSARRIGPIDSIDEYLRRSDLVLHGPPESILPLEPIDIGEVAQTLMLTEELRASLGQGSGVITRAITPGLFNRQIDTTFNLPFHVAADFARMSAPLVEAANHAASILALRPRLDLFGDAIGARFAVEGFLANQRFQIAPAFAADLSRISEAILSSTSILSDTLAGRILEGVGVSEVASTWRTFVEADLSRGAMLGLSGDLLGVGGRGVLGVNLAAGIEAGVDLEVDEELVAWDMAPSATRERLLDRLRELNPSLPNKLRGAWERVTVGGPDAGAQAANSLIELLDWTFRAATASVDLVSWHSAEQRPAEELHRGRPTRSLKVSYLCRDEPSASLVRAFTKIISETFSSLQELKHNDDIVAPEIVRRLIPTVEAVLTFVLVR